MEAPLRGLYRKEWVVYAKEPFGGPEHVLKYLTGYTHRVALSNRRLVQLEDDRVTFTWKDYADGCRRKEMTLEAVEFVRRFALYIVPKGMVRIRHYGLLAHRDRGRGWRCAGRFWESGRSPGRRRRPRRHHNRRVVRDRPTAWRRPAERDRSRHGSSPAGRRLGLGLACWRCWRRRSSGGTRRRRRPHPRANHPRPFGSRSRTGAPLVAWVRCERPGGPTVPDGGNGIAWRSWTAHDPKTSAPILAMASPPARAGIGRPRAALGSTGDESPGTSRHRRIDRAEPQMSP